MYIKKLKRKCGVRGCKNTDTYAISKSREIGNSIIACKDCLMDALAQIEAQYKPIEEFKEAPAVEESPTVEEAPAEAVTEASADKPKRQRSK